MDDRPAEREPRPRGVGMYLDEEVVYRKDVVLLKITGESQKEAAARFVDEFLPPGSQVRRGPTLTGWFLISLPPEADGLDIAVEFGDVLPDYVDELSPEIAGEGRAGVAHPPSDPDLPHQWGIDAANIDDAWRYETGSPGVLVAILDSGIAMKESWISEHPDLQSSRIELGGNFADANYGDDPLTLPPKDDAGHGTHVLGIVAADTDNKVGVAGVNWVSAVLVERVMDLQGTLNGSWKLGLWMYDYQEAVDDAVTKAAIGPRLLIVNLSGGWSQDWSPVRDATKLIHDSDGLLVAAAGNRAAKDPLGPIDYPARYAKTAGMTVIAVGSIQQAVGAGNSLEPDPESKGGPELSVVAPGRDILSTTPTAGVMDSGVQLVAPGGYTPQTGTSMATPFVSGIASLVWSRYPKLTAQQVKDCIIRSAVPMEEGVEFRNEWGHGRVDAVGAICCPLRGCCRIRLRIPRLPGKAREAERALAEHRQHRTLQLGNRAPDA